MSDPGLHGHAQNSHEVPRGAAPAERHLPVTVRVELRLLALVSDLAGPLAVVAQLRGCSR